MLGIIKDIGTSGEKGNVFTGLLVGMPGFLLLHY